MSSFLRRLSLSRDEVGGDNHTGQQRSPLASTVSFNDFSMHVMMDEEHERLGSQDGKINDTKARSLPIGVPPSALATGGLGSSNLRMSTSASPSPSLALPKSLNIPSRSVASSVILETPKKANDDETPRSSLDLYDAGSSAVATPRSSATFGSGLSQNSGRSEELSMSPASPIPAPSSPRTPGGRRRKQKIHGLDYYEFCELVRAGSL